MRAAVLLVLGLGVAGGSYGPAVALDAPVGVWTLSESGTTRQCRLQFRAEAAATGQAVAMPPGCRRAFPVLSGVRSWSVPDGVHLALDDEVGANILMFGETGDGRLEAPAPEGGHSYVLTALAHQAPPRAAVSAPAGEAAAATPVVPQRPLPTAEEVAGHYAVMRGSRDTGCMVTLDDAGHGAAAALKARLAPACRDQGITIFDPAGWALKAGRLVLQARKGHTADFTQGDDGTWVKDAKGGQPLGLKRL